MRGSSPKTKHVDALVTHWKAQPLSTGTFKNRMAALRWLVSKLGKNGIIKADNAAYGIGLRASNVTGLEWSQVDLVRRLAWVHPDQAKARKAIPVPLNAEAVGIIRQWLGRHMTHVFSYHGKPITQVSTKAW